ncbi:hypothetical protein RJ639_035468 [Escallonia herrerae]|uniref:Replication factor-A protein 1 N-terminal domain-containing protein n=1 Tax=Escallonia herrerae TaxID=1293975 RepID=A0AA88WV65_9ASTE|nr:hypothetical protein RJ639_035468 [Escallonia herrerae]
MSIKLTEGAIVMLSSSNAKEVDVKPVLQVVDLRVVNMQNQSSGTERYRIMQDLPIVGHASHLAERFGPVRVAVEGVDRSIDPVRDYLDGTDTDESHEDVATMVDNC